MHTKSFKSLSFILFIISIFSFFFVASQHTHFVGAQVKISETDKKSTSEKLIFNEKISLDSSFPQASLNLDIPLVDLQKAMEQYYLNEYSDTEKELSQEEIPSNDLQDFYNQLSLNKSLASLDIHLDTATLKFEDDQLHIPRILISLSELKAKTFVPDHDIMVLNEAITFFGDRIVMVGYYDEENDLVTPLHLSNSTKPIFYNKDMQ